jgi:hypothetical protein
MAKKPARKLTVSDALVMIAAFAIGLGWSKFYQVHVNWEGPLGSRSIGPFHEFLELANGWMLGLPYFLAVLSLGLLLLRLRGRPVGRIRCAGRSPGAVAGLAVLISVSLDVLHALVVFPVGIIEDGFERSYYDLLYMQISGQNAGLAVAVAWALLVISGRWRREPGWLDAAGIVLGAVWLLQSLFEPFVSLVTMNPSVFPA